MTRDRLLISRILYSYLVLIFPTSFTTLHCNLLCTTDLKLDLGKCVIDHSDLHHWFHYSILQIKGKHYEPLYVAMTMSIMKDGHVTKWWQKWSGRFWWNLYDCHFKLLMFKVRGSIVVGKSKKLEGFVCLMAKFFTNIFLRVTLKAFKLENEIKIHDSTSYWLATYFVILNPLLTYFVSQGFFHDCSQLNFAKLRATSCAPFSSTSAFMMMTSPMMDISHLSCSKIHLTFSSKQKR